MKRAALEEFNPWWFKDSVPDELLWEYKRVYYNKAIEWLGKRQAVTLTGLRRVGKTTLMFQVIQHLLEEGTEPRDILYFSFDEKVSGLDDVLDAYREMHGRNLRKRTKYLFLDEIQKLEGWQNQMKKYYDLYPKLRFMVSGSESLFIRSKARETLAGRIHDIQMPTFSFKEFLGLLGENPDKLPVRDMEALFRK